MRARRAVMAAAALLTASLVLTGCGAGEGAGDSKEGRSAAEPAYGGREAADGASGPSNGSKAQASPGARTPAAAPHVIRTAELSVEVRDAAKAAAAARRVATDAGGRVESESTERIDDTHLASRIVLRVPQERYDSVLAELAGAGRLLSRKADAKDVTDQVVDVDSRVATQRASVARVRALMDRATKLGDVVTLEGELSRRQADLEALLAQQASLKDRTTLATITLGLTEPESAPADDGSGRPGFLDALAGGWHALLSAAAWLLVVLAALAPWLAAAALAYALWRRLVRPRLRRRTRRVPEPRPSAPRDGRAPVNAAGVPAQPVAPGAGPVGEPPAEAQD
ncbi:DUF4349 domain-containing protein [Streptomyces sp. NPDC004327]|uniref:DUF4349 domain-containing protein n=1 Tax=unclassified Streptomyces TaxID=2593676 RepID=UPI00367A7E4F